MAYSPAWHGRFIWDDAAHVSLNPALRSWDGLRAMWTTPGAVPQYYPLTFSIFWLEFHLWHLQTLGYHLVSILLHGVNALLVGLILRRLRVPGAWLAAALFAFHPVAVESVAWISELKNVGSTCFYLSSLWAALRGRFIDEEIRLDGRAWAWYGVSFFFFLCALLSKTTTCVLPVVLVLLILWKRRATIDDVLRLLPFFAASFFYGLQAAVLEKGSIGAEGSEWSFTVGQRLLIASRDLCFYAAKLVIPHPLIFIYPHWTIDPRNALLYVYPLAILGVLALLWGKRREWGNGPLVAVGFFLINLFPALGFVNFYPMRFSFVADHFQYVASLGLIALFAAAATRWFAEPWQKLPTALRLTIAILCACNLWLAVWRETWKYKSLEILWEDTVAKNPSAALAHSDLAALAMSRGDWKAAQHHLQFALALQPALAQAHFNEGLYWRHIGQLPEALAEFRQAIVLEPLHSDFQNALGETFLWAGNTTGARRVIQNALTLWPDDAALQSTLDHIDHPKRYAQIALKCGGRGTGDFRRGEPVLGRSIA